MFNLTLLCTAINCRFNSLCVGPHQKRTNKQKSITHNQTENATLRNVTHRNAIQANKYCFSKWNLSTWAARRGSVVVVVGWHNDEANTTSYVLSAPILVYAVVPFIYRAQALVHNERVLS